MPKTITRWLWRCDNPFCERITATTTATPPNLCPKCTYTALGLMREACAHECICPEHTDPKARHLAHCVPCCDGTTCQTCNITLKENTAQDHQTNCHSPAP